MRLLLFGFFATVAAASRVFKLEGHFLPHDVEDVERGLHDLSVHRRLEDDVRQRLGHILPEIETFFIETFKVHRLRSTKPTPVFTAYLTVSSTRQELLQLFDEIEDLYVFTMMELESLPQDKHSSRPLNVDSTDPPVPVSDCYSGGILLPNKTCACEPFFYGIECQNVKCLHSGNQDLILNCICPPGIYGQFCEPRPCLPIMQNAIDNSQQSFVLVLNTKLSMSYIINSLASQLPGYFAKTDAINPNLYADYVLCIYIQYRGFGNIITVYFPTRVAFLNYLQSVVTVKSGDASQPTSEAIVETLSHTVVGFSNVFVFADSYDMPFAESTVLSSSEGELIQKAISWRQRISFFIAQSDSNPLDPTNDGYKVYQRLAAATLGDVISFDYNEFNKVFAMLPNWMQNENIQGRYGTTGSQEITLNADYMNQTIFVLVSADSEGNMPTIKVDGESSLQIVQSGRRFQFFQTSPVGSTHNLQINGSSWRIRAFVHSTSTALIGYDTNIDVDAGSAATPYQPLPFITGIQLGFQAQTVILKWINLQDGETEKDQHPLYSTARFARCSHPLDFGVSATPCVRGAFAQSLTFSPGGPELSPVRVIPGFCGDLDSHQPPEWQCFNNGTVLNGQTCLCADHFTAPDCSVPICENGGVPSPFPGNGQGFCTCPTGFQGDFCDILQCKVPSFDEFSNRERTLALVMQNSMSQVWINADLQQGIEQALKELEGPDRFSQFLLCEFNTVQYNGDWINREYLNTFITGAEFLLALAPDKVAYTASASPTQQPLAAISNTIPQIKYDRSTIFIFVDTMDDTLDYNVDDIIVNLVKRRIEIDIVITPPFGMLNLCMNASSAEFYHQIAKKTGGVILNLCNPYQYDGNPIVELFTGYGITHHHTENINEAYFNCYKPTTLLFSLDNELDDVFLIVNSDSTQNFTTSEKNLDNSTDVSILTSFSTMPFLAIYNVTAVEGNVNMYSVTIQNGEGASPGNCYARVASKTDVAVYLAFSTDPSVDALYKTLDYVIPQSPVVHIVAPGAVVNDVMMHATNESGQAYYFSAGSRRELCEYEFYFTRKFICDQLYDSFLINMVFTSTDTLSNGTAIQRSLRSFCYTNPQVCAHGGLKNSAGKCQCLKQFTGDNCEFPICENGGSVVSYECSCPAGYSGEFCQHYDCIDYNFMETADPREFDFRQFTLILNSNVNNLFTNVLVSNIIKNVVFEWFFAGVNSANKYYSLITYDQDNINDIESTSDQDKYVASVQKEVSNFNPEPANYSFALNAINEAYEVNIISPCIVFLFASGHTYNTQKLQEFLQQRIDTQVNVFYVSNDPIPQQPSGGNYDYLFSVAVRQSGGRLIPLTNSGVAQLTSVMGSASSENALVLDDAEKDCSNGVDFVFLVENASYAVTVLVTGNNVNAPGAVVIFDGSGNEISVLKINTLLSDTGAVEFFFGDIIKEKQEMPRFGTWKASVRTTSGSCYIQARVSSPVRIVPGFTSDPKLDFVNSAPFSMPSVKQYNSSTYMTIRTANSDDVVYSLDIYATDYQKPWSTRKHLRTVPINKRADRCAYQYITDQWQVDTSMFQKFVISGMDRKRTPFQRVIFYTMPSKSSEAATCINGKRDAYGMCQCDSGFTGDYCDQSICINGGSPSMGLCVCPSGYYGPICDQYISA